MNPEPMDEQEDEKTADEKGLLGRLGRHVSSPTAIVAIIIGLIGILVLILGPWSAGPIPTGPGGGILRTGGQITTTPLVGLQFQCLSLPTETEEAESFPPPNCPVQSSILLFAYNLSQFNFFLTVMARAPDGSVIRLVPGLSLEEVVELKKDTSVTLVGSPVSLEQFPSPGTYGIYAVFTQQQPDLEDIERRVGGEQAFPDQTVVSIRVLYLRSFWPPESP